MIQNDLKMKGRDAIRAGKVTCPNVIDVFERKSSGNGVDVL
jgi:hypothetical protein